MAEFQNSRNSRGELPPFRPLKRSAPRAWHYLMESKTFQLLEPSAPRLELTYGELNPSALSNGQFLVPPSSLI